MTEIPPFHQLNPVQQSAVVRGQWQAVSQMLGASQDYCRAFYMGGRKMAPPSVVPKRSEEEEERLRLIREVKRCKREGMSRRATASSLKVTRSVISQYWGE